MLKLKKHSWDYGSWVDHTWMAELDLGWFVIVPSVNLHYFAFGFGWRSECVAFYVGPFILTIYFNQ